MNTEEIHHHPDPAAAANGIEVMEVSPGCAKASLTIGPEHLNGLGTTHGGILFLLSDAVFALACNSRGIKTVASKCDITYHLATSVGDHLLASCTEYYLKGRNGIYDVTIKNQHEQVVAHFRGHSIALK